ncbi:hypothetical protein LIER_10180 [Lithospermum erythrorhizon]|uniref:MULE transposase domain-containing protein n=1 Tax=Lithospermum erythrorhizon TaxID=34254 RepID=A0AAV3PKD2_LITER
MTDQQKVMCFSELPCVSVKSWFVLPKLTFSCLQGLELAIERELPVAEHRLCVRHRQANWSKKYAGKLFKDAMWEAARAASVLYFEAHMEEIRKMSVDAFDALDKIDKKKWTRCAFRPGSNCPMLVNNWAEAFNVVIIKARDQPIIAMLNTIYQLIMTKIVTDRDAILKWKEKVCPRVHKTL